MAHFIRDFYYGKCEPQALSEHDGDMLKLSDRLDEKEEFLNERLEGEERVSFNDYTGTWIAFCDKACADSFVTGFRMGARFAIDVFGGRKSG